MRTRLPGLALFAVMAILFLIANRDAYEGYFQDDDLSNLAWARRVSIPQYAAALVSPVFSRETFRPVALFYFWVAEKAFGLQFPGYLVPVHLFHLLNVLLVWLLVRRLGASFFASSAGTLLFAFHMAAFDAYWKPMYVFDVLCATFCLLSFLLFTDQRWILSLIAFWLAYKSKELAVMLPAVFACYEFWFGKRRWKPLVPFFGVAASFGVQQVVLNSPQQGEQELRFTLRALRNTAFYYSGRIFLVPFGGAVLPALAVLVKDKRVWLGLATMFLFFIPLAFLQDRLSAANCYVPLIGFALALSGVADSRFRPLVALFFVLWIPWNVLHLRLNRSQALAIATEHRQYVSALQSLAQASPALSTFVYDGRPFTFHRWGIEGALRLVFPNRNVQLYAMEEPRARAALHSGQAALLTWDPLDRKLNVTVPKGDL